MLNLGLPFLRVVGAYKIYTYFVPWQAVQKVPFYLFGLVHWPLYFSDFLIGRRHISSLWFMMYLYNYWLCITYFKSSLGKKETHMFYIASFITFSVFSELPWKSTVLVRYKLNIFRTPRVNQFDIRALLFGGYTRFIPLDKWSYMDNGKPSFW